uniref:Candidate secreted effector n=1 Tax=Meloidogyne incognita TaxID=6306 RepID=A0A914P0T9_MELIC
MFHAGRCDCHCILQNIDSFCRCSRQSVLLLVFVHRLCNIRPKLHPNKIDYFFLLHTI